MKSLKMKCKENSISETILMNPLRIDDPFHVHKSLLRGLLTDVSRLRPGTKGLGRDLVTLEARLEHEGVSWLAQSLVVLGKAFDQGLASGHFTCPIGFRKSKGSVIPALLRGIMGDVFHPSTGELVKERDCTEDVSILRQLLFFLAEVLSYIEESRKTFKEYEEFFQRYGRVDNGNLSARSRPYIPGLILASSKS
jgi:hypothetical protein